ncbi:MAG: carboxypeptidase-like regulatory domain-containing protein, partial [Acidimicrobiia bacterium]
MRPASCRTFGNKEQRHPTIHVHWVCWCSLFTLALTAQAFAQADTSSVAGRVLDAYGGLLPGATVTARNIESGYIRIAETSEHGQYRMSAVLPGEYEITARRAGFRATTQKGVVLTLGSEVVLDFELAISGVAEELTVTADVPIVE